MTSATMRAGECASVLVDYQARLMPAIDGGEQVLGRAAILTQVATLLSVPVLGTEQVPDKLGPLPTVLRSACRAVLNKHSFSGCADGLLDLLAAEAPEAQQLVIAGCETHVCLLQTALGLLGNGFQVFVVADACGSREASSKELALGRLAASGAVIVNVEMVAFEWLGSARNEKFAAVHQLIK